MDFKPIRLNGRYFVWHADIYDGLPNRPVPAQMLAESLFVKEKLEQGWTTGVSLCNDYLHIGLYRPLCS
jgi:hypothetical protein